MSTYPPIYDFVMANLKAKTIPQKTIARESGVPFGTLSKIAQGLVKDPGVHTVQRLADYFSGKKPQAQQPVEQEAA